MFCSSFYPLSLESKLLEMLATSKLERFQYRTKVYVILVKVTRVIDVSPYLNGWHAFGVSIWPTDGQTGDHGLVLRISA